MDIVMKVNRILVEGLKAEKVPAWSATLASSFPASLSYLDRYLQDYRRLGFDRSILESEVRSELTAVIKTNFTLKFEVGSYEVPPSGEKPLVEADSRAEEKMPIEEVDESSPANVPEEWQLSINLRHLIWKRRLNLQDLADSLRLSREELVLRLQAIMPADPLLDLPLRAWFALFYNNGDELEISARKRPL